MIVIYFISKKSFTINPIRKTLIFRTKVIEILSILGKYLSIVGSTIPIYNAKEDYPSDLEHN